MSEILTTASKLAWLKIAILSLISILAFSTRFFSVLRFESIIHEFDPWFNYRTTVELVQGGFYEFVNWFDQLSWYPLGRVVGGTVYPGIMVTAGTIHWVLNKLNFPVHIREVCVFFAPFFSAFTACAAYLLGKEMQDDGAGLLAAIFLGIAPGYISRSVAGSYDNEGISIFLLVITFYFWIKAQKTGSAFHAAIAAVFYFWMVSAWGGYVFIINIIPLHAFCLILMGRFNMKLYVAYCTFYTIGTLSSFQIPFVGFAPTKTNDHMAALGVFGLLQIVAFVVFVKQYLSPSEFKAALSGIVLATIVLGFGGIIFLTAKGYIAPWGGRFYSLWDTNYAKKHIPIIASVSEHQPTAWGSFFWDLQLLMPIFPAGLYLCLKRLRNEHVFTIIYCVTGSYFAGVMIRLILTLTPIVCICGGIAFSTFLTTYLRQPPAELLEEPEGEDKNNSKSSARENAGRFIWSRDISFTVLLPFILLLIQFGFHCTYVTSNSYSNPSVVLSAGRPDGTRSIIDDFREAYYWLRQNTPEDAKILSWWDYGYQITGMSNRTVLVDNNTWNNTHIATVGKVLASTEEVAYPVMKKLDVDYVLVIFGALLGFSGDDINKFLWMIRIGQGVYPDDVKERAYFTPSGQYLVDAGATEAMKNSLLYKMSYYRFPELSMGRPARDNVRDQIIPSTPIKLSTVEEVFTTENWLVRLYKVKKPDNIGRSLFAASNFGRKRGRRSRRDLEIL